jgi:PqqD family protein of HPr-rel-A system
MNIQRLKSLMINDEGFAFDPRSGHTYNLNPTGLLVINCLKSGATSEETVAALTQEFEVDEHMADRDVEAFCNDLQRLRLVEAGASA